MPASDDEMPFTPPDGCYLAILNMITKYTYTRNCAGDFCEERLSLYRLNSFHLEGNAPPIEDMSQVKAYDDYLSAYGREIAEIFGYDIDDFATASVINCPTYNLRKKGTGVFYVDCFIDESPNDDFKFRTPNFPENINGDDCDYHVEAVIIGPLDEKDEDWIQFKDDSSKDGLQYITSNNDLWFVEATCRHGVFSLTERDFFSRPN